MDDKISGAELNKLWEQRVLDKGTDFVYFVDISEFSPDIIGEYKSAVLFGKALSKEYIRTIREGGEPEHKEVFNTERKMDTLALKVAEMLEAEGYPSVGRLKTGLLPHKTVALRAGLGFIGKNNLLVTPMYGCALMLGKVLTTAPFETIRVEPQEPQCGECRVCASVCQSNALLGTTWALGMTREEIITRKLCTLCLKCMACCPYTVKYSQDN